MTPLTPSTLVQESALALESAAAAASLAFYEEMKLWLPAAPYDWDQMSERVKAAWRLAAKAAREAR